MDALAHMALALRGARQVWSEVPQQLGELWATRGTQRTHRSLPSGSAPLTVDIMPLPTWLRRGSTPELLPDPPGQQPWRWLLACALLTVLLTVLLVVFLAPEPAMTWLRLPKSTALVVLVAFSALLISSAVLTRWPDPNDRKKELTRLVLLGWVVGFWVVAILSGTAWFAMDRPPFDLPQKLDAQELEAITTRAFAIITGMGGIALLVTAYRRQRTTEQDAEREDVRLFTERFTTASEQLGHEKPAVRLAGVHALNHLADDTRNDDLRQMVIDVLCAYLRMPCEPAPDNLPDEATEKERSTHRERQLAYESFREVRHTIIDVLVTRLRRDPFWRLMKYDFSRVVFDGGDFTGARFLREEDAVSFRGARFRGGTVLFEDAYLLGTADFTDAEFAGGKVSFTGATLGCSFERARFCGADVSFDHTKIAGASFQHARFESRDITFFGATFAGWVGFNRAHFDGAAVLIQSSTISGDMDFDHARFNGPGGIVFNNSLIEDGAVDFQEAWLLDGTLSFDNITLTGQSRRRARISFGRIILGETRLSFVGARLFSGYVNFSTVEFTHREAARECFPAGLGEAVEPGDAEVLLPAEWACTEERPPAAPGAQRRPGRRLRPAREGR
ncbi:pentapeptide repeat-containing protein [Nocardiopsis alkaliphila]|uniref:pentapeptide repeat-containing protein n=1 Tax=Nocardiopsis alkaliphila TaxID=225762 RepID=UPI0006842DCC|nr:pentapeptide repeat-containing protein [Nocardiopsis alkaliphila]